jgi:hypothetical protein
VIRLCILKAIMEGRCIMRFLPPVALAVGLMAGSADARTYGALGVGHASCGSWTEARQHGGRQSQMIEQWIFGFLSGVGYQGPANPLNDVDAATVLAWIDNLLQHSPPRNDHLRRREIQ